MQKTTPPDDLIIVYVKKKKIVVKDFIDLTKPDERQKPISVTISTVNLKNKLEMKKNIKNEK